MEPTRPEDTNQLDRIRLCNCQTFIHLNRKNKQRNKIKSAKVDPIAITESIQIQRDNVSKVNKRRKKNPNDEYEYEYQSNEEEVLNCSNFIIK